MDRDIYKYLLLLKRVGGLRESYLYSTYIALIGILTLYSALYNDYIIEGILEI